ncbi:MAG: hypothetical protein DSY42_04760 [Aquifex sp.]|nr:MAG: hypothetical protein DSY42_04760 [Aquifex sp.]
MKRAIFHKLFLDEYKTYFSLEVGSYTYSKYTESYQKDIFDSQGFFVGSYTGDFEEESFTAYVDTVEMFEKISSEAKKRIEIFPAGILQLPVNSGYLLVDDFIGERLLRSYVGVDSIFEKVYIFADIWLSLDRSISNSYYLTPVDNSDERLEVSGWLEEGKIITYVYLELIPSSSSEILKMKIREMAFRVASFYYGFGDVFLGWGFGDRILTFIPLRSDPEGYIWIRMPPLKQDKWSVFHSSPVEILEEGYQDNLEFSGGWHTFDKGWNGQFICEHSGPYPKTMNRKVEDGWRKIVNLHLTVPRNWLIYVPSEYKNYFLSVYQEVRKKAEEEIIKQEVYISRYPCI